MNVMLNPTKFDPVEDSRQEGILRSLAIELVRDIADPEDVLARYGLTHDGYQELAQTRVFKQMLDQAVKEWSTTGTGERIKIKAAALVEEALPAMFGELTNAQNTLTSRADLLGRIAKIGGLGESRQGDQGSKETFSISINIGAERPTIIQAPMPERIIEGLNYEEQ